VPFPPLVEEGPLRVPIVWTGKRFSALDWLITGAAGALFITTTIVPPRSSHWVGGTLFDESARDFLRLDAADHRFSARDVSDVILSLEATWPFFVDAIIGAWWYHGSPDAAAEMALIDLKALAITAALQGSANYLGSRERPYGRNCGRSFLPEETQDCSGSRRYRSFFSGHASISFMSASLICVHHVKLRLIGSRGAAIATCGVAYGGATAAALLRTMGDVHYTSDIILGALVGTAVGVGIPLLHYRKPRARDDRKPGVEATLIPFGAGLGIGGTF
jgi:hypothetical protein